MVEEQLGGAIVDAAIVTVGELTHLPDDHYYEDVLNRYSIVRQFLSTFLAMPQHAVAAPQRFTRAMTP